MSKTKRSREFPDIAREQLQEYIKRHGHNNVSFARRCNVSDSTIGHYLKPGWMYQEAVVKKIAAAMGISRHMLMTGKEDPLIAKALSPEITSKKIITPGNVPTVAKHLEHRKKLDAIDKKIKAIKTLIAQGWSMDEATETVDLVPCPLCDGVGYSEPSKKSN